MGDRLEGVVAGDVEGHGRARLSGRVHLAEGPEADAATDEQADDDEHRQEGEDPPDVAPIGTYDARAEGEHVVGVVPVVTLPVRRARPCLCGSPVPGEPRRARNPPPSLRVAGSGAPADSSRTGSSTVLTATPPAAPKHGGRATLAASPRRRPCRRRAGPRLGVHARTPSGRGRR